MVIAMLEADLLAACLRQPEDDRWCVRAITSQMPCLRWLLYFDHCAFLALTVVGLRSEKCLIIHDALQVAISHT
jgi:hypothetical protein